MSEPKTPRLPYFIPMADTEARAEILSRGRRRRARWLHDVLSLVPAAQQADALAAALEMERCETETIWELSGTWLSTVPQAYRAGILDGTEDAGRALGLIDALPTDAPLTRH